MTAVIIIFGIVLPLLLCFGRLLLEARRFYSDKTSETNPKDDLKGCEYCIDGAALVIGKTNDTGIGIQYPNRLMAYGYDVHGTGENGIHVNINYCPMCGVKLGA